MIFDLDGVLVDSEPYWRQGFRAAVQQIAHGLGASAPEMSDEDLKKYEGGRVPDTVERLATHLFPGEEDRSTALLPAAVDRAIDTAMGLLADDPRAITASVATAHALHDDGYVLAVASSSAPRFIAAALEATGLADEVAVFVSSFGLDEPKPHPRVYLDALSALEARQEQSVAIEDSPVGVEAALRAGLRTIWVTNSPSGSLSGHPGPALCVVDELSVADVHEMFER